MLGNFLSILISNVTWHFLSEIKDSQSYVVEVIFNSVVDHRVRGIFELQRILTDFLVISNLHLLLLAHVELVMVARR